MKKRIAVLDANYPRMWMQEKLGSGNDSSRAARIQLLAPIMEINGERATIEIYPFREVFVSHESPRDFGTNNSGIIALVCYEYSLQSLTFSWSSYELSDEIRAN